ncbi:MAG TPA: OmpH family outer membrane protein [Terriglobales bacterium]|nr:OmpH family outer membrane protein [Terriglobales bacterium]
MRRKLTPAVVAIATILSLAAFAQTGSAASNPGPASPPAPTAPVVTKVGIIDFQRAVVATNEGQREFEALAKKFDPKQTELKNQNDEVENLKKQLQTQGDKLNDEARATLVRNIDVKQKALQRNLEDAQSEAQREQNEVFGKVAAKVYKTLERYAASNGFTVILNYQEGDPQGQLLWAVPQVNITKEVVEAYNRDSGVAPPATPATKPASSSKPMTPARPAPAAPKK